ncbi:AMP-binding protein, partial [Nocardia halotolerans]
MTETPAAPQDSYPPSAEFAAAANAGAELYERAETDRDGFWTEQANRLHWHKPFSQVLDWSDAPVARWFADGELNVAYNCVDRHVIDGHGDQVAIHWEGEPGDARAITYRELLEEVSRAANYLTELGLVAGDRVAIYMPMVPEAIVAMLACARLGLTHSVVFAGFSPSALRQRVDDAEARLVITTDGQWRRGKPAPLKEAVDEALAAKGDVPSSVEHVLVVRRVGTEIPWTDGRDLWWHETVSTASPSHEAQPFPAEHPLFILYTSGTTGKPKGILHTSGGYLT